MERMSNYGDDEPSLEFDIDAILDSSPNPLDQQQHDHHRRETSPQRAPPSAPPQPPQVTYPDLIMADVLDDNYTISTLGRDQSLMTRDDPPIAMFRPSFDPDRFADEEAPSLPKYSYKNTVRNNKSEEATRRLSPSGAGGGDNPSLGSGSASNRTNVSYRDLYMVVIVMAILLLAIITGLAIWLIALRTSATLAEGSSISSEKETIWDQPTLSPTRIPTRFDDVLTKTPTVPTIAPTRVTITAAPIRDTPRPTTAPDPLEPTSQPKTPAPSKATPAPTTRPTLSPTPVPTVKPTPLPTPLPTPASIAVQNARTKFLQVLESYSSSAVSSTLARVESPQYHALDWLIHDPNFEQYSNARLIQRWVLASFALGLEDTDWKDDKTAIARSYSPLNLPQALDTWVKYTDECTWFYSSVDNAQLCNEEGLYHRIDLRSQNLAGTIPTEIGLLSNHLAFVYLYDNEIMGTLPSELALLTRLERLELTRNCLTGTIPSELGDLSKSLVFLGLGVNDFEGRLPTEMGKLTVLRTVGLERNRFSGSIPTHFGNMVEARLLNLDRNQLSGTVPPNLWRMTLLRGLNLSYNIDLVGTIPYPLCEQRLTYMEADCDNVECPCCTACH